MGSSMAFCLCLHYKNQKEILGEGFLVKYSFFLFLYFFSFPFLSFFMLQNILIVTVEGTFHFM